MHCDISLVPFFLKKKYPHARNREMAIGLVYASAFAFVVAAYLAYAMISMYCMADDLAWVLLYFLSKHAKNMMREREGRWMTSFCGRITMVLASSLSVE